MSKLANKALNIPKGVTVVVHPDYAEIKGPKKTVQIKLFPKIHLAQENNTLHVSLNNESDKESTDAILGTLWALIRNTFIGVSEGFKIKLDIVGVGYRAQAQGHKLNLTLGFSHPVVFDIPKEVEVKTPSQTEIELFSHDKQLLGQVAAEIRSYRFPECYKGKGIKFAGEVIVLKETKKK